MTPSPLPRFVGPAQVRQRMRLAAALGMLAIAAITTGGVASLTGGSRSDSRDGPRTEAAMGSELPQFSVHFVERQVEAAERASSSARFAIQAARKLRLLDEREIDELEHRLDAAAIDMTSTAARQTTTRPGTEAPDRAAKVDTRELESRAL